jgi:hypothetical protein
MLLECRFGALPQEVTQQVNTASSESLDAWARRLLSASSLAEVFTP